MTNREYSAFLSHSSEDAARAMEITEGIEARGLSVWIAPRNVQPGEDWPKEIIRGIQSSKCFILLLSGSANLSDNVAREVERASHYQKPVYSIRIEDVNLSPKLEYFISMHHWVDALEGLVDRKLDELVSAMQGGKSWASRTGTVEPVDDPFTVASAHRGPMLPEPSPTEVWGEKFSREFQDQISKLKLGEGGREWSAPYTIQWSSDDRLIVFRNKAVVEIDTELAIITKRYWIPWYRDKDIYDVGCVPNDRKLCIVGRDCKTVAISSRSWGPSDRSLHSQNSDFNRVLVSKSGKVWLHLSNEEIRLADVWSGSDTRKLDIQYDRIGYWSDKFSWSATDRYVCIFNPLLGKGECPQIIDLENNETTQNLLVNQYGLPRARVVRGTAWHPTRDIIAFAYSGLKFEPPHGFCVLDPTSKQVLHDQAVDRPGVICSIDWCAEGRRLAMGGSDDAILVWDFRSGRAERLIAHKAPICEVHFSPDGQRLVTSSDDRKTIIWGGGLRWHKLAEFNGIVKSDYMLRFNGLPWSQDGRKLAIYDDTNPCAVQVFELQ